MKLRASGKELKELREHFGLSQSVFANAINVSQPAVSLLESSRRKYLSLDPSYLAQLDKGALSWMLKFADKQLRLTVQVRLATGTTHKIFGALPAGYIEQHLNDIIGATMSEARKQIENYRNSDQPIAAERQP